tara:strand:+ start:267 stop:545 length:279 start_codon:yes stop_codon:yes gene_type:complete
MYHAHDEAPRSADFWYEVRSRPVGVFPKDPEVFFVKAHSVFTDSWFSIATEECGIKVVDLSEAITTELEGVRELPEVSFTSIKRMFPIMHGR